MLHKEHHGPRAILNALERLAAGYASECERLRQDLQIAESQLRDYQERFGKPFLHEALLTQLTDLRDQLRTLLFGTPQQTDGDSLLTAADVAERIKILNGAHTVEAAPERLGLSLGTAEEPVTARIRRRLQAALVSDSGYDPSQHRASTETR